jgi:hypothetical protein
VVGAYQLAAALAAAGGDHRVAFPAYERSMRHFVEQNQQLALKASGAMIPRTAAGLWLRNRMLGIIPLIIPLLRSLNLRPDAGIQRAANSLALAALQTPLSAARRALIAALAAGISSCRRATMVWCRRAATSSPVPGPPGC